MKIFVVNLDRSAERWSKISSQFEELGIEYQRISAIDGRELSLSDFVDDRACRSHMGRSILPGEVGCFLSHMKALQSFLDTSDDLCVVIEDDVRLQETFVDCVHKVADEVRRMPKNRTLCVNLAPSDYKYVSRYASLAGSTLFCAHRFPMSTMGLLWTRAGAKVVLESATPITMPFDNFLRHLLTGRNAGFSLSPALMEHRGVESEIVDTSSKSYLRRSRSYFIIRARRMLSEKLRGTVGLLLWQLTGNKPSN